MVCSIQTYFLLILHAYYYHHFNVFVKTILQLVIPSPVFSPVFSNVIPQFGNITVKQLEN